MTNRVQSLRSSSAGVRPTGQPPGVIYTNWPDNQLGVVNAAGTAVDLLAVRYFSTLASYAVGDYVVQGGNLYRATNPSSAGAFVPANWSKVTSLSDTAAYLPLAGGTLTGPLVLSGDPTLATGAATKQYVDLRLLLTGGTLSGPLILAADPTAPLGAATKQTVDSKLPLAGGTLSGPLVLPPGSASVTSLNFGAAGTGFYGSTTQLDFSVSGSIRGIFTATQFTSYVPMFNADGGAGAPTYSWLNDANCGFYRAGAGDIRLSMGGADCVRFLSSDKSANFSGPVVLPANPTTALQAATKQYVDAAPAPPPVGVVLPFAGNPAPAGWAFCYGQNILRSSAPALNALFAASTPAYPFGAGDGSTTMGLPDLRGRTVFGKDDMGGAAAGRLSSAAAGGIAGTTLGAVGGEQAHTLVIGELTYHQHLVSASRSANVNATGAATYMTSLQSQSAGANQAMSEFTGGNTAFNDVPPGIVLSYIIKIA